MRIATEAKPGPPGSSPATLVSVVVVAMVAFLPAGRAAAPSGLDTPVTATWHGIGPRVFAERIAAVIARPVVIDRRLDPERPITLDCHDEPALDVLRRGAVQAGGELALLGGAVLIVPPGSAERIVRADTAAAARIAGLPVRQRAVLEAQRPWNWPAGSTPAALVQDLARETGIPLDGLAAVPHDHLPAATLADLSCSTRLALVLAQYDLRVDWQAAAGGGSAVKPRGRILAIDADLPATSSPQVAADGPRGAGPKPRRTAPVGDATYTLEVAAPLDQLLTVVARRLDLELAIDRESLARRGVAGQEIVRTSVRDVSREGLLDAILRPLGLTWSIDDRTLSVR